jgi:hypothetical protein
MLRSLQKMISVPVPPVTEAGGSILDASDDSLDHNSIILSIVPHTKQI